MPHFFFQRIFLVIFLSFIAFFAHIPTKQIFANSSKICLTMIVKNEEKIIERCLDSVKDHVDYVVICDTGSTDQTISVIEEYMKKWQVPGRIYKHEWKNFGHNRTLSAEAAKEALQELKFPLERTYLLLIDADMIVKWDPSFSMSQLTADSYSILQKSAYYSHYNTRFIRASLPWRCIGVTHEYWGCQSAKPTLKLDSVRIKDYNDGGSKADKFERDLKLLTEGLKEEPNNVRYMFYCAQALQALNRYSDAIRLYLNRIDRGGWNEEVWYSKYMIGECYQEMGYWDQALHWYLDAYQFNPKRAEPLKNIATYYRLNGKNDLAYLFAKQGKQIPYPLDEILFISHAVYDYQFDEELSIAAYYTPFKEEGFEAANRLLLKKNVPNLVKNTTLKNILFYVQNLKDAIFKEITIDRPLIKEGSTDRYFAMNPTIQKDTNGYLVICRTVNFIRKGTHYLSLNPDDSTIRTKNFLLEYDKDLNLLSQDEILDDFPRRRVESQVQGLEDCRLIRLKDENWFICSVFDDEYQKVKQCLCKLGSSGSNKSSQIEKFFPLVKEGLNSCEKNWLPFTHHDALFAIYSYDPFIINQINCKNGQLKTVLNQSVDHDFLGFRGSAGPIDFEDGYLVLVHEYAFKDQRYYLHRFIYFDKNWKPKSISKPFTFMHQGVEYCCGMTIDHSKNNCILTIGIEDQRAYFCIVSLETIKSLLEPL